LSDIEKITKDNDRLKDEVMELQAEIIRLRSELNKDSWYVATRGDGK